MHAFQNFLENKQHAISLFPEMCISKDARSRRPAAADKTMIIGTMIRSSVSRVPACSIVRRAVRACCVRVTLDWSTLDPEKIRYPFYDVVPRPHCQRFGQEFASVTVERIAIRITMDYWCIYEKFEDGKMWTHTTCKRICLKYPSSAILCIIIKEIIKEIIFYLVSHFEILFMKTRIGTRVDSSNNTQYETISWIFYSDDRVFE